MAKHWPFSIQGRLSLGSNKQFVFQTDNVAQNFLKAEVNEIQK